MNLNSLSEESVEYILKGLEILAKAGELDMKDVLKISILHQQIDNEATEILNKINNEHVPSTLNRMPNKDERFIYGKEEYVKK